MKVTKNKKSQDICWIPRFLYLRPKEGVTITVEENGVGAPYRKAVWMPGQSFLRGIAPAITTVIITGVVIFTPLSLSTGF